MTTRFRAGGAKNGWWVKIDRQADFYPGQPEHFTIKVFHSRSFAQGEDGAAEAANRLCTALNDVLDNLEIDEEQIP